MDKLIIIGISSTAEVVSSFVERYSLFNVIGFAVNEKYRNKESYCGLPVYAIENLDEIIDKEKDFLFVAIQWNNLNADRRKVYEMLKAQGYHFANLISPTAIVNGNLKGDNCWIADRAVVDFGAIIGYDVFVKIGAVVGDHAIVNDHCFIGATSFIAGASVIGTQSFVGLGAIIFDQVKVGEMCIVGAATALKRNLPDYAVIKSNKDNYIVKQYSRDTIESKLQYAKNIREKE